MVKRYTVLMLVAAGFMWLPAQANAQTTSTPSTLTGLMQDQFVKNIVLATTPNGNGIAAHTATFGTDASTLAVTALVQSVSQQIAQQVANVPLGSSSGGFTYTFDPTAGTFTRSTSTFGPAFAERAATIGLHKASFGANYQHANYNSLDGRNLANGDVQFFLPHQTLTPASFVQGDMIEAQAELKISSDTFVLFGNYGVTKKLDVGIAIPINHVNIDLDYHATILDFATHTVAPTTHLFSNGLKTDDFVSSGSATGIGDVVVRTKYNLLSKPTQGVALGLDLHLPTGDSANMLGTGGTQAEFYLIASSTMGKFAPHANVGFTAASNGVSNQVDYLGGTEYAASPKLTIALDLIGRTFTGSQRLVADPIQHQFQEGNTAPIETVTLPALALQSGNLTSLLGAAGVKFNAVGNLLVSAHVVFTLNSAGLKRGVTPVVGFDWAF
jgi:hypothetical protein